MLRVETRCRSLDELVAAFATLVDDRSIVVLTEQSWPVGTRLTFSIALADGAAAMTGEGEVVETTPAPRASLRLRFTALDASGRQVHRRMLDHKNGVRSPRPDESATRAVVKVPELPARAAAPASTARARASSAFPVPGSVPPRREARDTRTVRPAERPDLDFDIARMIQLIRILPEGDPAVVMKVVRASLGSVGVPLPPIIDDALCRQADLEDRITQLDHEIDARAQEIEERLQEIARLDADHAEVTRVRDRLEMAERAPRR